MCESESENSAQLALYEMLLGKLNQEGDGIWARFNMLVAINIALFAGFAYVCFAETQPESWKLLAGGVDVGGLVLSGWSVYVLYRLWGWHDNWRSKIKDIRTKPPEEILKSITDSPGRRTLISWLRQATFRYTQPFFWVFLFAWVGLLLLLLLGKLDRGVDASPANSQTQTVQFLSPEPNTHGTE